MAMQKIKKAVAMTLAMTMCWSTLSVQALATEGSSEQVVPGANTTISGEGTAEAPTVTVTVTETTEGNKTTTDTDTKWEGETTVESETGDGENDGTTTTVEGQETKVETETVDGRDRPTQQTGEVEGEETTKTETTETEVKEDQVISTDPDEVDTTTHVEGGDAQTEWEKNGDDEWVEGTPNYEENWTPAGTEPVVEEGVTDEDGWQETGTPTQNTETTDIELPDPLEDDDAILVLTPGGQAEDKLAVTVREVLMENDDWDGFDFGVIQALEKDGDGKIETTETNGNVTVKVVKEAIKKNGIIVGYTETITETTVTPGTPGSPVDTGETPEAETGYTKGTITPDYPDYADDDDYVKTDDNGNVIEGIQTTIEEIKDGDTVIGHRITQVVTTPNHNVDTTEATDETTTENAPTETRYDPPAKPEESVKTENGVVTTVTVEEVYDEDGNLGYKTTTTEAKNGSVYKTGTETIWGKTITVNKTTVTDPTTKEVTTDTTTVTTTVTEIYGVTETRDVALTQERETKIETEEEKTTTSYQLVEIDGNVYYIFTGEMGEVDGTNTIIQDNKYMTPDPSLNTNNDGWKTATNDIQGNGDGSNNYSWYVGNGSSGGSAYSEADLQNMRKNMKKGEFVLIGYGLYSEFNMYDDQNVNHSARQYVLMDKDGNRYYGYCVELNAGLKWGNTNTGVYTEKNIGTLVGDDLYFKDGTLAVNRISSVANNGYWGQAEGLGSLQAVKDLLIREGHADVAAAITDGQALAATQAAIWKYGTHKNGGTFNNIDEVIEYYYGNNKDATKQYNKNSTDQTYLNIKTLFNVLTSVAENETASVAEVIDKDDLTGATIVLDKKAVDENGNVKTDANGNEKYDTDLSFTLAVSTSSINGDLIVQVMQGGEIVATKRLAGTNDSEENYTTIHPNANGTYTIPDLELAENVTITLNLEGTQHLANGVYVYQCNASQNFVGLTQKQNQVDLEVDMVFHVEEPAAEPMEKQTTTGARGKTDIKTEIRNGTRQDTRTGTTTQDMGGTAATTGTETTVIYADVTVTEMIETETLRQWTEEWLENFRYPSRNNTPDPEEPIYIPEEPVPLADLPEDPVPLAELPEDPVPLADIPDEDVPLVELPEDPVPLVDIPDEDVPLADVPKTGDIAGMWYGLTLLTGGGLLGLLIPRRNKQEDQ